MRIYNTELGWVIETPVGLSKAQIQRAIDFHMKVIKQRWTGWSSDKRESYGKILEKLSVETIRQKLVNKYAWEKEKTLYLNEK